MNICILGDSHCGALYRAWQQIKTKYSQHELTFFASRGSTLVNLKIENRCLVSKSPVVTRSIKRSSGGLDSVDVEKYDLFLLYGLKATPCFTTSNLYLSSQLEEALVKDLLHGTPSHILLTRLRKLTSAKIYVGHSPLIAAKTQNSVNKQDEYADGLRFINQNYYEKNNAKMLSQPLTTMVNGQNTELNFTLGSKRLDLGIKAESIEHPADDREHMNDEYGKIWLTDFLQQIS